MAIRGAQQVESRRSRPVPQADDLTRPFWQAAAEGRLAIQACDRCGTHQHPPRPTCHACGSAELTFREVSGRGHLWSWTTTFRPLLRGFAEALPYMCLVVELADPRGIFLVCDSVHGGIDVGALRTGLPMEIRFVRDEAGATVLPQFEPVAQATEA